MKSTTPLLVLISVAFFSAQALSQTLSDEVDKMFTAKIQGPILTPSTIMKSTGRAGVDLGSIRVRSPIKKINLVQFTAPSINTGCGGIDLNAGSFSMISAPELIALFRSIAANSLSYAFGQALRALCQSCYSAIMSLQQKIAELNRHMQDSCNIGTMIADSLLSGSEESIQTNARKGLCNIFAGSGAGDQASCIESENSHSEPEFLSWLDGINNSLAGDNIDPTFAIPKGNILAIAHTKVFSTNQAMNPNYKQMFFGSSTITDLEIALSLLGSDCLNCPSDSNQVESAVSKVSQGATDIATKSEHKQRLLSLTNMVNTSGEMNADSLTEARYQCISSTAAPLDACNSPQAIPINYPDVFGTDALGDSITNMVDFVHSQLSTIITKLQEGVDTFTSQESAYVGMLPIQYRRAIMDGKQEYAVVIQKDIQHLSKIVVYNMAIELASAVIKQQSTLSSVAKHAVSNYMERTKGTRDNIKDLHVQIDALKKMKSATQKLLSDTNALDEYFTNTMAEIEKAKQNHNR